MFCVVAKALLLAMTKRFQPDFFIIREINDLDKAGAGDDTHLHPKTLVLSHLLGGEFRILVQLFLTMLLGKIRGSDTTG